MIARLGMVIIIIISVIFSFISIGIGIIYYLPKQQAPKSNNYPMDKIINSENYTTYNHKLVNSDLDTIQIDWTDINQNIIFVFYYQYTGTNNLITFKNITKINSSQRLIQTYSFSDIQKDDVFAASITCKNLSVNRIKIGDIQSYDGKFNKILMDCSNLTVTKK
jgi:hypothetical protein